MSIADFLHAQSVIMKISMNKSYILYLFVCNIVSILYVLIEKRISSLYCLPIIFPIQFFCHLFPPFLASSTRLNCLILDCPIGLLPLKCNLNPLQDILVLSIHVAWPNHCSHFCFKSIDKFWIPLKTFVSIVWILLLLSLFRVHILTLHIRIGLKYIWCCFALF
jgi:hypothetical protein